MKYGAGFDPLHYAIHSEYRAVIRDHFDFVIPTWGMMPTDHHDTECLFVNPHVIRGVELARQDGLEVHGHCLLTRFSIPEWLKQQALTPETARARLYSQIYEIVDFWEDRISDWIVSNEMIGSEGVTPNHPYTKLLGQEALSIAFIAAADACSGKNPKYRLWLQEFGVQNPKLWRKVYEIVANLIKQEIPIHGVSAHVHVNLFPVRTKYKIANIAANLYPYHGIRLNLLKLQIERFRKLGLEFHASEMTVWIGEAKESRIAAQGALYNRYISHCLKNKCSKVSVWSPVDDPRFPKLSWHWQGSPDFPGIWRWSAQEHKYLQKFPIELKQ